VINVTPCESGIRHGNSWAHIDGWSERVLEYIIAMESQTAE